MMESLKISRLSAAMWGGLSVVGVSVMLVAGIIYTKARVGVLEAEKQAAFEQLKRASNAASREAELNELRAALASGNMTASFLDTNDETKALSLLQSQLQEIVVGSGATFVASRNLNAERAGELMLAGLRLDVLGSIGDLQKLLFSIERHEPRLLTRNVILVQGGQRHPTSNDMMLRAQFDIFGAVAP